MPELLTQFKSTLKSAVVAHYKQLTANLPDVYGYSLFTEDGLSSIGSAANRESYLKKPKSDPNYDSSRYLAVEWGQWSDFGLFDRVNVILNEMHAESPSELQQVLPTCLDVLIELESEGLFGARTDDRFIVICLSDSDDPIMMESAKRLNTAKAFTEYASLF